MLGLKGFLKTVFTVQSIFSLVLVGKSLALVCMQAQLCKVADKLTGILHFHTFNCTAVTTFDRNCNEQNVYDVHFLKMSPCPSGGAH